MALKENELHIAHTTIQFHGIYDKDIHEIC